MDCREFFNKKAATWNQTVHHDTRKINALLDMVGIYKGFRILDVGCGTGILVPFLMERVGQEGLVTCIDISDQMIRIAREKYKYPNLSFVVDDIHNAKLDGKYHVAVCYSAFPHFEDKKTALLNIRGLLHQEGKLAIMHSQGRNQINNLHRRVGGGLEKHLLPPSGELERLMAECGIQPLLSIDNQEVYLVVGQKKDA